MMDKVVLNTWLVCALSPVMKMLRIDGINMTKIHIRTCVILRTKLLRLCLSMIRTKISNSFYIPAGRLPEVTDPPPRAPLPLRASAVLWVLMTSSLVMVRRAFLTP